MRNENGITLIGLILIVLVIFIAIGAIVVLTSSDTGSEEIVAGSENYEIADDYEEYETEEKEEEPKFDAENIAQYLEFDYNDSEKTATLTGIKPEYTKVVDGERIPIYIQVDDYKCTELDLPSEVEKNGN